MSQLIIPVECTKNDPENYNTSAEYVKCQTRKIIIGAIALAVIIAIIMVILFIMGNTLWAAILLVGGAIIVGGTLMMGSYTAKSQYYNMTADLVTQLGMVEGFDTSKFQGVSTDLSSILEAIKGNEDAKKSYKEFLENRTREKQARATAYRTGTWM
jgi:ABC-type multidrug transport system fused ATPase/permease subunit